MTTNTTPTNDADDLFATPDARAAFFNGLRDLKESCGNNQHEQALMCIAACLDHGINEGNRIVGILGSIEFKKSHAGKMLNDFCGSAQRGCLWGKDAAGLYQLHCTQSSHSGGHFVY